jgi:dipeptidyl aminopeptidase/acylaminoacyl peptidase
MVFESASEKKPTFHPRLDERHPVTLRVGQQQIFGMLHLPLTGLPAPAVLICHGLAGDKYGRYRVYVRLAEELAQRGIASLRFDYRGCGDSEGSFEQVTVESQLEDALAATQFLQQHQKIDSQRLGIFGRSFGGLIAALCARQSKAFRSLCLWSAVFNGDPWRHLWQQLEKGMLTAEQLQQTLNFNGYSACRTLFEQLLAIDMQQTMKGLTDVPMLHIHGVKDTRVTITHADNYAECRRESLAPSSFIRLPEGDHEFTQPNEREEALEATIEWMRQTL